MTYSGTAESGFSIGSYDRQRYTSLELVNSIADITKLLDQGLNLMQQNNRSRLDMRLLVQQDMLTEIRSMLGTMHGMEIAVIKLPNQLCELQLCYNNVNRCLASETVSNMREAISRSIVDSMQASVKRTPSVAELCEQGFRVVRDHFTSQEIFALWQPFGYSEQECQAFAESCSRSSNTQQIWGLRNPESQLVSLLLLAADSNCFESTEWATHREFRGQGYINPLLQVAHWAFFEDNPETALYAHCVYNGSLKTALRNNGHVDLENSLLTNHVTISSFAIDPHNDSLDVFDGAQYLRSFAMVQFAQPQLDVAAVNQILNY